jgi:transposase InsO family protein
VDDVKRECLAAIPDTSISGKRVARELTTLIDSRGKPGMIVSDNGTEFTSNAILGWAKDHRVEWHYIAPGKPMQNGHIESFNGRMRDELLNESLFMDLDSGSPAHRRLDRRLQHREAALLARIQNAGGLCRYTHRAEGRNVGQGSNRRWMKVQ